MSGPRKLNSPDIVTAIPQVTDLFYFANPTNGLGRKNTISSLVSLLASSIAAPVRSYADITAMLANLDIPVLFFAFVADAEDDPDAGAGWGLYLYQTGDRDELSSYTLIMYEAFSGGGGTVDHWRGSQAIADAYPAAGTGSGTAGAIQAGDTYYLTVSSTLGGDLWNAGTLLIALTNAPGTTDANWLKKA